MVTRGECGVMVDKPMSVSNAGLDEVPRSGDDAVDGGVAAKVYSASANPEVLNWVPVDATKVLDVGCGAGGNARALMSEGRLIDGVTLSHDEAHQASACCRKV